ncbi:hypothetical protein [Schlesneria paludicola]|uniref:hypothetical protein n=1 Tax=Schlesneria paludicola TaxID=360056 RepID=UPI0012F7F8D1|nr:hypothetical protein [Schlesneria paludicola]
MTQSASTSDVVLKLLLRADECAERHEWSIADSLFCDAISCDATPRSRIAYGVYLTEQERYFEAISTFTVVLDGVDRAAIAIVCHNLAAIYREVGDSDLARRFQWRATVMQEDLGSPEILGMANDALINGRHDLAETLIETAILMDDDPDDEPDPDLTATAALVHASTDSLEEGLLLLFQAYCRHRQVGNLRAMGLDLLNMASVFGTLDRPRAERKCLVRAIRCFGQASAPYSGSRAVQQLERLDRVQDVRMFDVRRN